MFRGFVFTHKNFCLYPSNLSLLYQINAKLKNFETVVPYSVVFKACNNSQNIPSYLAELSSLVFYRKIQVNTLVVCFYFLKAFCNLHIKNFMKVKF